MPARSSGEPGPDPIDIAVGLRVRDLRKQRGMPQAQLGAALGITFQQIQKYERGTNRISASMLVRAAEALGVQAADLLPASDAAPLPPAAIHLSLRGADELVEGYAAIRSPLRRRAVLQLVRALRTSPDNDGADAELD